MALPSSSYSGAALPAFRASSRSFSLRRSSRVFLTGASMAAAKALVGAAEVDAMLASLWVCPGPRSRIGKSLESEVLHESWWWQAQVWP